MIYIATIDNQEYLIEILDDEHVNVNGVVFEVNFEAVSGQPLFTLLVDGRSYEAFVDQEEDHWHVLLKGSLYPVQVVDEREKRLRAAGGGGRVQTEDIHLKAPMPGLILTVTTQEGEMVEKGDVLLILESMKMQNELRSPRAGKILRMRAHPGESVERNQVLLVIGPQD